ncbi:LOW QUALITY PROTEIN: kinesin-like protein KIF2C [Glossophaga mutica]
MTGPHQQVGPHQPLKVQKEQKQPRSLVALRTPPAEEEDLRASNNRCPMKHWDGVLAPQPLWSQKMKEKQRLCSHRDARIPGYTARPSREKEQKSRVLLIEPYTCMWADNVLLDAGPPRNVCPPVAEIPFPMVSEEAEEQVHSSQGSSSASPVNSVRRKSCTVKDVEKNEEQTRREESPELWNENEVNSGAGHAEIQFWFGALPFSRVNGSGIEEHRICVCVRKCLLIKQELPKEEIHVISVPSKCLLFVHEPSLKVDLTKYLKNQAFCFDFALDERASNEAVYRFTARTLVHPIFQGGKAMCFPYGQTGSGKTHTTGGSLYGKSQNASKGIYAMATHNVFLLKNLPRYCNLGLEVYVTFFEIYNGRRLFHLLNKKATLRVLGDGKQQMQVLGLQEHLVSCADDVVRMIDIGRMGLCGQSAPISGTQIRSPPIISIANQQTCMEGTEIKTSLLALKECIRALGQNKAHTPFRQSKLAQVLQDSFILENSRTCMIATISPGISSCECTLNTLRYADRVKELSPHNGPIGEQPVQMEVEQTEASLNGSLTTDNFPKEELSSQMSSFNEVMTQIRELEERAVEELKEIIQQGPGWLEVSELTEQQNYDLETFVTKAESTLAQQAKYFSALQDTINALRLAMQLEEQASKQMNSEKQPQ